MKINISFVCGLVNDLKCFFTLRLSIDQNFIIPIKKSQFITP